MKSASLTAVLCAMLSVLALNKPAVNAQEYTGGTLHRRSYFYVGAQYTEIDGGTVAYGQMYVEKLVPARVTQPLPLLIIHGHSMTGTNYLNTPDGRQGWADYFMSKGYQIYLVDQPARARSPYINGVNGVNSTQDNLDVYHAESRYTRTKEYKLWPQAILQTRWVGNGSLGDPTFDAFHTATVPSLLDPKEASEYIRHAGSLLLDKIGPVILFTHSESGQFGWILADARPDHVKAIVATDPTGPPFQQAVFSTKAARPYGITETPLQFSPPLEPFDQLHPTVYSTDPANNYTCFQISHLTPRKLTNIRMPVLAITAEASYHAVYDNCTVLFLERAGVDVKHVHLAEDVGIHGNGHMMHLESNNLEIAENVIEKWINSLH